ncbi:MAG: bifunctional precorrin-2 dehydrogenase/sirohydrochlorin ferrochelatase [Methanobrevibacter sp.]|nr:bifunctional precorrin-2 dehydrogenase/sirohydrochlorin ferrochelatase [Methanobrevibacter sp.]
MDWTALYFKTSGLKVFILGTGEVATRRANRFLDHGAVVKLAGNSIDEELLNKGAELHSTDEVDELVGWCDLAVVASGDKELCDYVSSISDEKLVNRADNPDLGDIIVPTSFNIGDVEISIFTGAKSPLMARQLRKKIQSVITEEDILEIELQDYSRSLLKEIIPNQKDRRDYLYRIFEDEDIQNLIKAREIDKAKAVICELIKEDFNDT